MTTLEDRLYQGNRAREILENEAFISAYDAIEQDVIEQWTSSPARDAEGRERLWTYLQMLHKLKAQITQTLETGQLAQLELQHKQTLVDRARKIFPSM